MADGLPDVIDLLMELAINPLCALYAQAEDSDKQEYFYKLLYEISLKSGRRIREDMISSTSAEADT